MIGGRRTKNHTPKNALAKRCALKDAGQFDADFDVQYSALKGNIVELAIVVSQLQGQFRRDRRANLNFTVGHAVSVNLQPALDDICIGDGERIAASSNLNKGSLFVALVEGFYDILRYIDHQCAALSMMLKDIPSQRFIRELYIGTARSPT